MKALAIMEPPTYWPQKHESFFLTVSYHVPETPALASVQDLN